MTINNSSATSILQRVRRMFSRGYEKLTIQELKTARFVQTKFPRVGYQTVRIVFSLAKLVLAAFLIWVALWALFLMFAWELFKSIDFEKYNKEDEAKAEEFGSFEHQNKYPEFYDNNGDPF